MKIFTLTTLAIFSSLVLIGQNEEAMDKIKAARIALITERLELSPEQAERFWPLYNDYQSRREEINREYKLARKDHDPNQATEEENRRLLELGTKIKERQLNLEKSYSDRFLKVIDNRQMLNLRKAESDFREMIIQRLRQQKMQNQRQRNDQQIQRRRNN